MPRLNCSLFLASIAIWPVFTPQLLAQPQRKGLAAPAPPEVAVSIHVRVAELWKTEPMKEFRSLIERAGPKALETYAKRFALTPGDIDELTIFALTGPPERPNQLRPPLAVVKLRSPVPEEKLASFATPQAETRKIGDMTFHVDAASGMALYVADPRTVFIGPPETIQSALGGGMPAQNLQAAISAMATDKLATVIVSRAAAPARELDSAPPPFANLLQARRAILTLDLRSDIALQLSLQYPTLEAAAEGEKSAKEALELARRQLQLMKREVGRPLSDPAPATPAEWPQAVAALAGLAAIAQGDEILGNLPLSRDGSTVSTQIRLPMQPIPPVAVTAALAAAGFTGYWSMAEAPRSARPPVMRGNEAKTANAMKMIGLAIHNYAAAYNLFPAQAILSKDGKPLLSWRVAILPFLEQDSLYKQFKLDEPWDSDHNKKLIDKMPAIYASPNAPPTRDPGRTHFQVFVGGGAAWAPGPRGPRFQDFTDGLSNTIMVAQARDAVPWTKPEDMSYEPKKPVPALLADANTNSVLFLMGDGSVLRKPANLAEQLIRAAITKAGGEIVDWSTDMKGQMAPEPGRPKHVPPPVPPRPSTEPKRDPP